MLSVSMSLPSIINGFSALSTGISAISKSIEGGFIPTLLASVFGLKATEGQTIRQVVTNKLLGESYAGAATNVELFNAALKKALLPVAKWIIIIGAIAAAIALLIKAIENAKKNSLEGILKSSEESAEALRTKLEETK